MLHSQKRNSLTIRIPIPSLRKIQMPPHFVLFGWSVLVNLQPCS